MAEQACSTLQPQSSDLIGWRFKTAAHSSKMLTKRHRLYRLAGQLAQAREGFAVAPGPCLSGSPPLLMAAARAGLVSQRGSDLSGWRFKTAVCPLLMSNLHCLTSPLRPCAINRGLEPAGHDPCATVKLSPLKLWLHGSLHRRWRVLNSLLERAALLFTHVALTLPLSSKINYRTCFSRVNRLGGFSSVRWASQPMSCTFLAKFCTRGPVNREPQRW